MCVCFCADIYLFVLLLFLLSVLYLNCRFPDTLYPALGKLNFVIFVRRVSLFGCYVVFHLNICVIYINFALFLPCDRISFLLTLPQNIRLYCQSSYATKLTTATNNRWYQRHLCVCLCLSARRKVRSHIQNSFSARVVGLLFFFFFLFCFSSVFFIYFFVSRWFVLMFWFARQRFISISCGNFSVSYES